MKRSQEQAIHANYGKRAGFRDQKGRLHITNKPLSIKDLKSKKYNPHDYNKYLDKESVEGLKEINRSRYDDLSVVRLTPEQIAERRHGDYKILVHEGTGAHTAFNSEGAYQKWLHSLGLKEGTKKDGFNWTEIIGSYERVNMKGNAKGLDMFGNKKGFKPVKVMSNGTVTRGYLQKGKQGTKIYELNPNYPRKIFPHTNDAL